MAPVKQTANYTIHQSGVKTADLIEIQARKCWEKSPSTWQDGIRVIRSGPASGTKLFYVNRYARDIGHLEPFFILRVLEGEHGATINIHEGDYGCNLLLSCESLNYTQDIERWLNGDLTCKHTDGG